MPTITPPKEIEPIKPAAEPTNAELQIALVKAQNEKEWRDFWRWLIMSIPAVLTGLATLYFTIKNNTDISKTDQKVEKADTDRTRIEEKIDTQKKVAETAVKTAKVAVEEARNIATETKSAVEEVKTVTEELKSKTDELTEKMNL